MSDYPTDRKRIGYFARFAKALFASDAIRSLGTDVVLLAIFIASREDKLHYAKAPEFWRAELMDRFNKTSPNWFVRVRSTAIDAGLLHYEDATRTKAGRYWTLVPDWLKPTFDSRQPYEIHTGRGEGYQIHTANDTEKHTASDTHSIPVTHKPTKRVRKQFQKPTLDEIRSYCESRKSSVHPKKFWDYFEAGNWTDSNGKSVHNWKQKLLTWESHTNITPNGKTDPSHQPFPSKARA